MLASNLRVASRSRVLRVAYDLYRSYARRAIRNVRTCRPAGFYDACFCAFSVRVIARRAPDGTPWPLPQLAGSAVFLVLPFSTLPSPAGSPPHPRRSSPVCTAPAPRRANAPRSNLTNPNRNPVAERSSLRSLAPIDRNASHGPPTTWPEITKKAAAFNRDHSPPAMPLAATACASRHSESSAA